MAENMSLCSNPSCPVENVTDFEERCFCGDADSETFMVCGVCEELTPKNDWLDKKRLYYPDPEPRQRRLKKTTENVALSASTLSVLSVSAPDEELIGPAQASNEQVQLPSGSEMSRDFSTDSFNDLLSVAQCPHCGKSLNRVKDNDSNQESFIFACQFCDHLTGVDDSLTMDDMHRLLDIVADSLEMATLKANQCPGGCGNDDLDKFVFDMTGDGRLLLKCSTCGHRQMITSEDDEESPPQTQTLHDNTPDIHCPCGNDNPNCFSIRYDVNGDPETVKCLVCDAITLLEPEQSRNGQAHDASKVAAKFKAPEGRTEIKNIKQLKKANHIAWHQQLAYWHHALVVAVGELSGKVKVIHYNGPNGGCKGKILEEWIDIDLKKEALYRLDYDKCHPPDEVLQRARSRLGEESYGLLSNNCEHYVQWCKTGVARSGQVESFYDACRNIQKKVVTFATKDSTKQAIKIGKRAISTYGKLSSKMPWGSSETVKGSTKLLGKTSVDLAKREATDVASGLGKLDYAAIGLVVGIEGYRTYSSINKAYKKKENGDISHDEFIRFTIKRSSQGVGSATGSVAGGLIGQMLIPVPVVGSLVGATLGSFLGEGVGTYVGRKIVQKVDGK